MSVPTAADLFFDVVIPGGRIFHQTDFDVSALDDEATAVARRFGGGTISSRMKGGSWVISMWVPEDARLQDVVGEIKRLPEWALPRSYGARVVTAGTAEAGRAAVAREILGVAEELVAADANRDYKERTRYVRSLISDIERGLREHERRQSKEPQDWGFTGDMGHVAEQLEEVSRFISGR